MGTRRPDKNRSLVWPLDFLFLFIHFFFFHLSSFTRATRENRTHREKNEAREKSLPNHSQIPTPALIEMMSGGTSMDMGPYPQPGVGPPVTGMNMPQHGSPQVPPSFELRQATVERTNKRLV